MSIELSSSDELSEFVDQLLHDGINSGPGTLLSDEWWANKRKTLARDALGDSAKKEEPLLRLLTVQPRKRANRRSP